MTSALPVNGFIGPNGAQPALAEQTTGGGVVSSDKSKEWQMELLMEKLRSKASSFKSLVETAKNIRMAMLDKRFGIDSVEKNQLQKSLDALQHSIKVTSLQSMIERLESLSRQLGLKFMMSGPPTTTSTELFISSDMFFLEVLLEPSGAVKDVKIHHEGKAEQQSCEELVACLSRGDFVDFTTQLEGLASIYQLNADKKVKCKAFSALQSLETDLGILAQLQMFMKEPFNVVHKSPVGILERRKGGHAMKLTYFVSPYDLIDQENKSCEALSLETVISKKVGHSVTVCMEGSTAHKLPTSSIISVNRGPTGKSTPSYASLTSANSSMLPACFVLKLAKKMPMCLELIRKIQKVTDLECTDISAPYPLLSMIVQHASDKQLDCQNNRGLTVSLPDQQHCYFMTENRNMEGVLVGSIPFTHPAHVPQILVFLRQQALFNTLISSCVRPMARQDSDHTTIFEVSALSWQCISVSLEHPFEETLATAELDLSDISALKCKLYGVSITNTEQTSDLSGKVLQRCLSIPLTMRTLIKTWEGRTFMLNPIGGGNNSFNNNLGTGREQNNHNGSNVPEFGNEDIIIKQEPGTGMNGTGSTGRQQQQQQQPPTQQQQPQQNQQQNQQQQQSFLDAGAENSIGFPSFSGSSDTPPAAMLNPLQLGALPTTPTPSGDGKSKKSRKRKTADGSWKSPKRKNDPDSNEILLESSSSDSTPLGTPTGGKDVMNDTRTPTPTSAASITSGGLDLSNLDPLDVLSTDKSSDYDLDNDAEIMQVEPTVASLEEALKRERKLKKRAEEKPSPTNVFEDNKTLVSPSVSITPISSGSSSQSASYNSMLTSIGLDRRPGIEIIPITSLPQTPLPNSITITAINNPSKSSSTTSSSSSSSSSGTSQGLGDERSKERKSSKNRSSSSSIEDKNKLEKKRKRKRESSPMGPPEKLPLKQVSSNIDPLSKPVSVSIKPASESPPASSSSRPSSPATTLRKFSPSPTRGNPLVLVGKSSPTSLKQSSSSSSSSSSSTGGNGTGGGSGSKPVPSPKHSPVYSSPKHMSSMPSSSVSPKHGTSSPKHGNSGSAGKPSMSALKSAANSPSGKSGDASSISSKTKISSLQSTSPSSSAISLSALSSSTSSSSSLGSKESRDKEARKTSSLIFGSSGGSSSGHQSPKSKSMSSKPKAIDSEQQQASLSSGSGGSTPPSDPSKSALTSTQQQQQQARNRKGSLSAVIDKLKNAQHCTDDAMSSSGSNLAPTPTTGGSSSSSSTSNPASKNPSDTKNPTEYMVKPSSDGMKLTINKTRTKDLKSNNSSLKLSSVALGGTSGSAGGLTITPVTTPGNVSPKLFSGLKTGVISGPVSRKPQAQTTPKVRSTSPLTSSSGMGSGKAGLVSGQKLSSGGLKSGSGSGLLSSSSGLGKSLSAKSFSSTSGSSMKQSSIAAELSRARDKARFKTAGDKSFVGKGGDLRKSSPSTVESENEKALRQHLASNILASSMSGLSNLPGLMVEGLIKQLDTKFQIPKLSARVNAADNADKRSVDKVDSGSKSSDASSRSSQIMSSPVVSSTSTVPKPEEAHPAMAHGASNSIVAHSGGNASTSTSISNAMSSHESDVPTNLSMQSDDSLQMKAEMSSSRPFLNTGVESSKEGIDLAGSKHSSYSIGSDTTGNLESLNLVTKGSEKYKSSDDKDQQQQQQHAVFHRISHVEKKSVESSITTPASITLTPIPPVSSSASASGSGTSSQEAAEMLLDFSTPKESGGGGGNVSSLPLKSAMSFTASSSPIRKNTTPPPPPPPPPLPPPPPPSVSPAVLAVPPSVSPISSFPQSPSVSLHIVKSPAPSPRVIPLSPHSASPCITDDELMDEAIVGS